LTPGSVGVAESSTGCSAIREPAAIAVLLPGNGPLTASVPVALVTATGPMVATARQVL
jgi:hypothetical protein